MMKKAFTISELLVAIGLLAAVLAASGMVFHYSIDAQRVATATAEIMRNLRAITDQLNADFQGLRKDGHLVLRSETIDGKRFDALYYFSTGDFQSWYEPDIRSNIARIYFGHDGVTVDNRQLPGNLVKDVRLLTPGRSGTDYNDVSFAQCRAAISAYFEDPYEILSSKRPRIDFDYDANDVSRLLCQYVGDVKIEWTCSRNFWTDPNQIEWFGSDNPIGGTFGTKIFETSGSVYRVAWTPHNGPYWPRAMRFTFTLYDSKGVIKNGKRFTHIVYIGE